VAPRIANFGEWRAHLLVRLRRQVAATHDPQLSSLLAELRGYPCDQPEPAVEMPGPGEIVVPLRLRNGDAELRFMSIVSTFGTPLDITLQELSIEAFFPADAATAAAQLAERAPVAIVTLGERGALAAGAEGTVRVEGVPVDAVDTTGAGDLFNAAYVWADHWGAALHERLRWAVLYAALSVRVATAVAGAVTLQALLEQGAELGLASPVRQPSATMKEERP
jgi:hypothetical protein